MPSTHQQFDKKQIKKLLVPLKEKLAVDKKLNTSTLVPFDGF